MLTGLCLILTASVDEGETDQEFNEVKGKVKLVQRRLNRNSEPQASIESGSYTYQYVYAKHMPSVRASESGNSVT
jgi:vesicle transport protein SEC22